MHHNVAVLQQVIGRVNMEVGKAGAVLRHMVQTMLKLVPVSHFRLGKTTQKKYLLIGQTHLDLVLTFILTDLKGSCSKPKNF